MVIYLPSISSSTGLSDDGGAEMAEQLMLPAVSFPR
jgi:hypothetical protein